MIFTVFNAPAEPARQWQAEVLEYSWQKLRQPGELIRLCATGAGPSPPTGCRGRVIETLSWNPHPYTNDRYAGYDTPAGLLEWLFRERIEGTVLLLETESILRRQVTTEVTPGRALATAWPDIPAGSGGPFGLRASFGFLARFCVNRELSLAPVRAPLLIHSSDLRRIAARWLELTGIIRSEAETAHGKPADADRLAYALAAAEYHIAHEPADLGIGTDGTTGDTPVVHYSLPIESPRGEIVWDPHVYRPWDPVHPGKARAGAGRDVLALLDEMVKRRESGEHLTGTRPQRRAGVREARVMDHMHLDVPGCSEGISLNSSAATIWELCDGQRSLVEIVRELEQRFDVPAETLRAAVESTAHELEQAGALELESLFA